MIAAGVLIVIGLAALYALGIRAIVQVPFRALGILVGGMAFHNVVLMFLLRLGTPAALIRVVQAWKEGILLLLLVLAVRSALIGWRAGRRPRLVFLDWAMVAFTMVVIVYALIPPSWFGVNVTLSQRLLATRVDLLLPSLYAFGRVFWSDRREDLTWVAAAIVGSAAVVGLVAAVELWLVPTSAWLDIGVNQLSSWLGFTYHGPKGMPENFFQSTVEGPLLRRAVSTYVSPLGIAYSGLLVVPLAIAWASQRTGRRLLRLGLLALTVIGMLFSLTRLTLGLMAVEFGLLALLVRRVWSFVATGLVAVGVLLMLYVYPQIGPLTSRSLTPLHHTVRLHILSGGDPSLSEHVGQLAYDLEYVRLHPLGTGLGSAVHRFGASRGPGESAILDVFGELGVLGGALYLPTYLLMILAGMRAYLGVRRDVLMSGLPFVAAIGGLALLPITLTSDVWSDLSVTFLFWWAAGSSVTIIAKASDRRRSSARA